MENNHENIYSESEVVEETAEVQATQTEDKTRESYPSIPGQDVISIDGRRMANLNKSRDDLLDLVESMRSGRILTGCIQGIERSNDKSPAFAVLYHGEYKVIIPASEAVIQPDEISDQNVDDVMYYQLNKRLGAEIDYIVKGLDEPNRLAIASRLDAMRAKQKQYYSSHDRDGAYLLREGVCAEARVVSVIRSGVFVELFGVEVFVPMKELSYQRMLDATSHFQTGQRVLVKILDLNRIDKKNINLNVSIKQASENPYEKALRKYSVGNRYVGTVSMVDTNGVFVALDGGIDCLCTYPKRGRPPRGARVTVRITGMSHETNRIWGVITHIAGIR